jgi:dUTPase
VVPTKLEPSPIPATVVADPDGVTLTGEVFSWVPDYVGNSHSVELRANVTPDVNGKKTLQIPYRVCARVDCGFSMKLPEGYVAAVSVRKDLAARGLVVLDSPGVVDGRVTVLLGNVGKEIVNVNYGDPIAQMWPSPVHKFRFEVITPLENV